MASTALAEATLAVKPDLSLPGVLHLTALMASMLAGGCLGPPASLM
jgi:hypothetical protein